MYVVNGASPSLTGCMFSGNTAGIDGGGLFTLNGSNPTVVNCTFLRNRSIDDGGGVRNLGSDPAFINCFFLGNVASGSAFAGAGGMFNFNAMEFFELEDEAQREAPQVKF